MARSRSSYQYEFIDKVLCIVDNDLPGRRSVTNDIENVLADIHLAEDQDLSGREIIYRDSMGLWDGISAVNTGFALSPEYTTEFLPIQTHDQSVAITKRKGM